jgi:hypothetical protein
MKKSLTIFFQVVIVLIGIGTLTFLLWEPHLEGRNANATVFEIYFNDPFLAYAYLASILFFVSLYQAFKVIGYIRQDKIFSQTTFKALKTIKYSSIAFIGCVVGGVIFIVLNSGDDDHAGGVAMGFLIIFGSSIIATAAAMYERSLRNTMNKKTKTT